MASIGLAVNLGQQNVRDRLDNAFGRAFQQVGDSRVDLGVAQSNGVVHAGKGIELDPKLRHRRAWPQLAVGFLEDVVEVGRKLS